jgi:hypothetical protein
MGQIAEMEELVKQPFPHKKYLVMGLLCGFLVPLVIIVIQTVLYDRITTPALFSNIFFLIFSNLILLNIYTYTAQYLYNHVGNRQIEVRVSGILVVITIIFLNWLYSKNFYLSKTSSTDVLILMIIPIYGILSLIVGYFLGGLIKKYKKQTRGNKA